MTFDDLQSFLTLQCQELGFSHFGHTKLEKPLSIDFYKSWIEQNYHGEMSYLKEHLPIKEDHRQKYAQAKTAFVFAIPYFPHPEPINLPVTTTRMSLYSQGADYHHWLQAKLKKIADLMQEKLPHEEFLCFTDSSPILERDLAYRAGLGWFGKNTCLIHPKKGSLFFIGEILSTLEPTAQLSPSADFCGTCRRCIDICPTNAIEENKKLDARKCISYLTIESRSVPPIELREKIGDWFFGCDLCQTVCPWNQKIFKDKIETVPIRNLDHDEKQKLIEDLRWIMASSGKEIERKFKGTALSRAGSFGLKRNAIVVTANQKLIELIPEVKSFQNHAKLTELAHWALKKLTQLTHS